MPSTGFSSRTASTVEYWPSRMSLKTSARPMRESSISRMIGPSLLESWLMTRYSIRSSFTGLLREFGDHLAHMDDLVIDPHTRRDVFVEGVLRLGGALQHGLLDGVQRLPQIADLAADVADDPVNDAVDGIALRATVAGRMHFLLAQSMLALAAPVVLRHPVDVVEHVAEIAGWSA